MIIQEEKTFLKYLEVLFANYKKNLVSMEKVLETIALYAVGGYNHVFVPVKINAEEQDSFSCEEYDGHFLYYLEDLLSVKIETLSRNKDSYATCNTNIDMIKNEEVGLVKLDEFIKAVFYGDDFDFLIINHDETDGGFLIGKKEMKYLIECINNFNDCYNTNNIGVISSCDSNEFSRCDKYFKYKNDIEDLKTFIRNKENGKEKNKTIVIDLSNAKECTLKLVVESIFCTYDNCNNYILYVDSIDKKLDLDNAIDLFCANVNEGYYDYLNTKISS